MTPAAQRDVHFAYQAQVKGTTPARVLFLQGPKDINAHVLAYLSQSELTHGTNQLIAHLAQGMKRVNFASPINTSSQLSYVNMIRY